MPIKFKDKASTQLASSFSSSATSLTVKTGKGALFPAIDGASNPNNDYFYITLEDASGNLELVKCAHRLAGTDALGSATYVLVRDVDGRNGGGRNWAADDIVAMRCASYMLEYILNAQTNLETHYADASGKHFPSGTRVTFNQTSAPTGWTKETSSTYNLAIPRMYSGTIGTGGASDFTTVFGTSKSTGSTAITTANMPSHNHGGTTGLVSADHTHTWGANTGGESVDHYHYYDHGFAPSWQSYDAGYYGAYIHNGSTGYNTGGRSSGHYHYVSGTTSGISANHNHSIPAEGSGTGHTHTVSMDVKYIGLIIAQKN